MAWRGGTREQNFIVVVVPFRTHVQSSITNPPFRRVNLSDFMLFNNAAMQYGLISFTTFHPNMTFELQFFGGRRLVANRFHFCIRISITIWAKKVEGHHWDVYFESHLAAWGDYIPPRWCSVTTRGLSHERAASSINCYAAWNLEDSRGGEEGTTSCL